MCVCVGGGGGGGVDCVNYTDSELTREVMDQAVIRETLSVVIFPLQEYPNKKDGDVITYLK